MSIRKDVEVLDKEKGNESAEESAKLVGESDVATNLLDQFRIVVDELGGDDLVNDGILVSEEERVDGVEGNDIPASPGRGK